MPKTAWLLVTELLVALTMTQAPQLSPQTKQDRKMNLYTDGTTKATTDEITTALAESQTNDKAVARETAAIELQAFIDADEKLKAAGITAVADEIDEMWVAVQLPDDIDGQPKFWAGQAASIGQDLGGNKVRTNANLMRDELTRISGLL
tara:strand:+ start:167 stop:613 length:447 start_codon:yes stop_codon:yes gene_type:complete